VNIVPRIESIYRWQGKVESNREWLLLIKTSAERFPEVRDAIRELHSYELPECIAIGIEDGSLEYLRWLAYSLVKEKEEDPAREIRVHLGKERFSLCLPSPPWLILAVFPEDSAARVQRKCRIIVGSLQSTMP
jgi:periplasmic divalent cation tolerance protein